MTNTVISYPTPAYQNLPIQPQFYQPQLAVISAISLGTSTTVTTSLANTCVVGQLVRFVMTPDSGTFQLNKLTGYITQIISSTQFVVAVDSSKMNAFVTPVGINTSQILPVGDINQGNINSNGNLNTSTKVPGSFINVS